MDDRTVVLFECGDVSPFRDLDAKAFDLAFQGVILIEPLAQLARIVPYNIVFLGVVPLSALKDVHPDLMLGDAVCAILQCAAAHVGQESR